MSAPPATCCVLCWRRECGTSYSPRAPQYTGPRPVGFAAEDSPTAPINSYGTSKLMSEWMLRDLAAASGLRYMALRYFNVAGSDMSGRIGQCTPGPHCSSRSPVKPAVGKRSHVSIFGTDYPTADGTGYATTSMSRISPRAHLAALDYLRRRRHAAVLNCGYGHGYSVRQVLESVQRVAGQQADDPRRAAARRRSPFSSHGRADPRAAGLAPEAR